jgi:CubicO group peptidase (beta-lactamase class C family)
MAIHTLFSSKRLARVFSNVVITLSFSASVAHAQTPELLGLWGREITFAPALQGELTLRHEGSAWRATIADAQATCAPTDGQIRCAFAGNRGSFRAALNDNATRIAGWWLRPSGETEDRRDPGGSGQPFATRIDLKRIRQGVWRGTVEPLADRFTLYLRIFRNDTGEIDDADRSAVVAVFRNPEINSIGGASYFYVKRDGDSVRFYRDLGDGTQVHHEATFERSPDRLRIAWKDLGTVVDLERRTPAQAVTFFSRPPGEAKYVYRRPTPTDDGWQTARARDVDIDEARLTRLVQRLIDANPAVRRPSLIHSVLIAHHGKLVLEEYFFGYGRDTPHDMRSAGKTFASVMLGAAMMDGVKIAPETPVYDLLADRGPFANPDARKERITIAHLMTHTSGLDCDDNNDNSLGNEGTMQAQRQQPDWWKYTLDLPMVHDPGTRYAYCSANSNLVGGALTKATGTWLPEIFERTVARPLQFGRYHWPLTAANEGYQGGGSFVRPRDLLKVGQVYLDGGVWKGRRIVPADWIAQSTARRVEITPATTGLSEQDFPNYYNKGADGYMWHLNELRSGERTYKEYEASGNGGQLLIVVPEADLAVVFTAGNYLQGGIWNRWRDTIVGQEIIPAIAGDHF